jgi:hypothetical protein
MLQPPVGSKMSGELLRDHQGPLAQAAGYHRQALERLHALDEPGVTPAPGYEELCLFEAAGYIAEAQRAGRAALTATGSPGAAAALRHYLAHLDQLARDVDLALYAAEILSQPAPHEPRGVAAPSWGARPVA